MDRDRRSPLHYASLEDQVDELKALVVAGEDINAQDSQGFTPLHFAAQSYSVASARELLIHGAEVDVKNGWGNTALFTATFNSRGRGELIELLLAHGADPYVVNNYGQSPIGLAHLIANYDVRRFFVQYAYEPPTPDAEPSSD